MSQIEQPIYTPQQILDRVATIEKVLETWKGKAEYAATIEMEIWALKVAAQTLETAHRIVEQKTFVSGEKFTKDSQAKIAMVVCEQISKLSVADVHG